MEFESFKSAFELGGQALALLKNAKDLLPNSPEKDAAAKALGEAEKAFQIAEAKAAQELGYELCKCLWPPQIMLLNPDGVCACPVCGRTEGAAFATRSMEAVEVTAKHDSKLSDGEHEILKMFFQVTDKGCVVAEISKYLDIPEPKVEYLLEKLEYAEYIHGSYAANCPVRYTLAQMGREHLVQTGVM